MADRQIASQVGAEVERGLAGSVAILTMRYRPHNLDEAKIPTGRVRTVAGLAGTEWAQQWAATRTVSDRNGGEITVPGRPWHFSDDDGEPERLPARRGEHNEEVLAELGYDGAEIDALRSRGVLVCDG